jgi:hypothetical protein
MHVYPIIGVLCKYSLFLDLFVLWFCVNVDVIRVTSFSVGLLTYLGLDVIPTLLFYNTYDMQSRQLEYIERCHGCAQ